MVTLVNRVRITTASTGTGTLTPGGAVDGFQDLAAAGVINGDELRYLLEEGSAWELGVGTYTAGTNTLTRSVIQSSAVGQPIHLTGTAIISLVITAEDLAAKVEISDPRLTNARAWTAATVSEAEAATGSATIRRAWTALRLRQAILGWWNTSTAKTKLDGIAPGAQVNVGTNLAIIGSGNSRTLTSSTGSNAALPLASTSNAGLMATDDKARLDALSAALGGAFTVHAASGNVFTNAKLIFRYNGTNIMTLDSGGNLTLRGNVTAFEDP